MATLGSANLGPSAFLVFTVTLSNLVCLLQNFVQCHRRREQMLQIWLPYDFYFLSKNHTVTKFAAFVHVVGDTGMCTTFLGLYENHSAKVKKSRHTFRKVAKFTANSRLKNVSLTNIFVLCLVNNQSCIIVSQNN